MGKETLLVTGEPGAGKSTAIGRLYERHPGKLTGIIAREIRDTEGVRQGFSSGTLDNPELVVIAHKALDSEHKVGSYGVNVDALDTIAYELASQIAKAREANMVVLFDEIGLMQTFSSLLQEQIEAVIESDRPAIMTIKQDDSMSEWLRDIKEKPGIRLITMTQDTREEVLGQLHSYVEEHTSANL